MPIRKLSVQLANQIAAGEVVERPASVVKELLENAVDAGASAITLELKQAGKQLIKVTDNGAGIPKDELVLALAPHATSKISCLEDLAAITTMGFRGEALASIASVSRLTLVSNTKGQPHGYQVEVSGPEQNPAVAPAAHPIGTSVIVRELFFNTPARRRFLKSDKTELTHIRELVTRLALVNYGIEFTLVSDGRTILQVPAQSKAQLPQRISKLLGADFNYPGITFDNTDPKLQSAWQAYQAAQSSYQSYGHYEAPDPLSTKLIEVHGLIIKPPSLIRTLPDRILTFLNGRIIADKMVNHALREGYLSVVQDDPSFKPCLRAIIFLRCDPHIVDVNVHPRKDEVRFHESNLIYDAIVTNVRAALLTHNLDAAAATKGSLDLSFDQDNKEAQSPHATEHAAQASELEATAMAQAKSATQPTTEAPAPERSAGQPDLVRARWDALKTKIAAKGSADAAPEALRPAVEAYLEQTTHAALTPLSTEAERLEGALVDFSTLKSGAELNEVWAQAAAVAQNALASNSAPTQPVGGEESSGTQAAAPGAARITPLGARAASAASQATVGVQPYAIRPKEGAAFQSATEPFPAGTAAQNAAAQHAVEQHAVEPGAGAPDIEPFPATGTPARTDPAEDSVELTLEKETEAPRSLLAARLQESRLRAHADPIVSPNFNPHSLMERAQNPLPAAEPSVELDLAFTGTTARAPAQASAPAQNNAPALASVLAQNNAPALASVLAQNNAPALAPALASVLAQNNAPAQDNVLAQVGAARAAAQGTAGDKALSAESGGKAQFLALVAPNVVLFAHAQRYFMAQGSALFAHFLAQVYRQGVASDTVERCELTLPFALRLEPTLLKAYKQTQLVSAAARAGFVVKSQLTRSAIELIAIPKMVRGTNLAQVAGQALALIAASHEGINSAGAAPESLVKCISQAKRYELNTVLDAKALIEHLQPKELEVLVSEATAAQGALDAKTKLNLSLKREGFTICELDLCSLAYQMLGQHK